MNSKSKKRWRSSSYRTLGTPGLDLPEDGVGEKQSFRIWVLNVLRNANKRKEIHILLVWLFQRFLLLRPANLRIWPRNWTYNCCNLANKPNRLPLKQEICVRFPGPTPVIRYEENIQLVTFNGKRLTHSPAICIPLDTIFRCWISCFSPVICGCLNSYFLL